MATQTHLGLEITDSSIKYFELRKQDALAVGYFGTLPLPAGLMENGSIRDGIRLKNIFSSIRSKAKWKDVTVSHLPDQVFLADILKEAGFKDIYFESPGEAVARAAMPEGSAEINMIVYFGGDKMDIYAGPRPAMNLLATLNFSSAMFEKMMDKEIVYSFIRERIDEQYISWHTHREEGRSRPKITNIILAGEMTDPEDLADYLKRSLKIKIGLANAWQNIFSLENHIPEISFRDSLKYSASIGLALRPFEK